MQDVVGRAFSVWAIGTEGVEISTKGELTFEADRLVFAGPPAPDPDQVSSLEIPLGQGATAIVAPNEGRPDLAGSMVTVTWEGKSVRFLPLSDADATAIARRVGVEAVPG